MLFSIQVLRALAVLAVVLSHAYPRFEIGRAGVDLFFVISGFIMVHSTGGAFGRSGAGRAFAERRLVRIVPLYWFCTAVTLAIISMPRLIANAPASTTLSHVLGSFFMVPVADRAGGILPILAVGWTLNFEMLFYVVFTLGLVYRAAVGISLIVVTLTSAVATGIMLSPAYPVLIYWTHPLLLEFLLGMAIGLLHLRGARLPHAAALASATFGMMMFAAFWLVDYRVPDRLADKSLALLWGLPAACIVVIALSDRGQTPPKWLKPLIFIGQASYAIYLVHYIVVILASVSPRIMKGGSAGIALAGILGGIALHLWAERPLNEAYRRWRRPRTSIVFSTAG